MTRDGEAWIAGADGCRAGWFRACLEPGTGELRFAIVASAPALLAEAPFPRLLAIDIPIGLAAAGVRRCDAEARARLGWPRRASVFPPPLRPVLAATSHAEASRLTRAIEGKGVSAQAWNIYAKIREVDDWLGASPAAAARVYEAHPELCFWAWAGGRPMAHAKRSPAGRGERLRLVEAWLGADVLARARAGLRRAEVADDDILDACATLWTAARIAKAEHVALGAPVGDATGLPMRICY